MKKIIVGSACLLAGTIFYGLYLVASVIYAQYFEFNSLLSAQGAMGWVPKYFSLILILSGIIFIVLGMKKND
ncbi:hypothetical protein L3476_19445 [Paenibacillus thiaminolyticus]|uniref:hypothetical protein n=1 Tax=Paenibacillus thiaminolyticus TaxID=49283 RepID=UPI0011651E3F|nr:hypothetical protein [Paenibacillus thiaminolyticus]MDG0872798.1 hypothetical protein [Paenibacillus thiaminolyticus]NGP60905.1 hypothetical protein [Paenibacillus thiaminolyticus]WCR25501.1 hypothetical protein L3476_19445 [Paenibacillus thiaminolyticus]